MALTVIRLASLAVRQAVPRLPDLLLLPDLTGTLLLVAGLLAALVGLPLALYGVAAGRGSAQRMRAGGPRAFEERVARTFRARGYRVVNRPHSGDHGVDLLVRRGPERAVVQCKMYRGTVGEPVVRDLVGAMVHERANRAYLVTTGRYTQPAREWARGKNVTLIDGQSPWWRVPAPARRVPQLLGAALAVGALLLVRAALSREVREPRPSGPVLPVTTMTQTPAIERPDPPPTVEPTAMPAPPTRVPDPRPPVTPVAPIVGEPAPQAPR